MPQILFPRLTPLLLSTLALSGISCVKAAPVAPANSAVAVARESFDSSREGVIHRQNGWVSNRNAMLQTAVNSEGGGKALQLAMPDGAASKILVPQGARGIVALDFKLLLGPKPATPGAKVLFFLRSSDKKRFALFYHDELSNWGLKSGADYPHVKAANNVGKWQNVRLVLNFNDKTISALLGVGAGYQTLLSNVKFDDQSADNFASIEIARNGQGSAAPVYVDEISVKNIAGANAAKSARTVLSAEMLKNARFPIFAPGETADVVFKANRAASAAPDSLEWQLFDWRNAEIRRGILPVGAGQWTGRAQFAALPAGYYAVRAQLKNGGDALPAQGSRPAEIMTFGILPDLRELPITTAESSRFGIWGGNFLQSDEWLKGDSLEPLVTTIGPMWNSVKRRWSELEPDFAGQWKPGNLDSEYLFRDILRHQMPYVVALEGIPAWNLDWRGKARPEGKPDYFQSIAYGPKDWNAYADFMRRAAREQVEIRRNHPYLKRSYYQIQHEPDWHWKGDDDTMLKMYQVAHRALHEADPQAVLLGPRYGVLKTGLANLERLFPQGLGKSLDGVAFHGYYLPPKISQSPEAAGTPDRIRRLRELTNRYVGPGAMMAQLEWGVRYNGNYEDITPEVLQLQAAQTARGHLIALGEGSDLSYLFYTSDFAAEPGYGLTFNLDMPDPNFGAMRVSPKPSYLASIALSRLLQGTQTLGRIQNREVLGYSFRRGSQTLVALWSPRDQKAVARLQTSAGTVQIIDLMGNARAARGGDISLSVDGNPTYILSDAPVTLAN